MQLARDLVEACASAELRHCCICCRQRGLGATFTLERSDYACPHLIQGPLLRRPVLEDLENGDAVFAQLRRTADTPLRQDCIAEYCLIELGIRAQRHAAATAFEIRHFTATHAEFLRELVE